MTKQKRLFKLDKDSRYGGNLFKTRRGRASGRPLATNKSMHLILKSSLAVDDWSFQKLNNKLMVRKIIKKFSDRYGVKILTQANVGNHLHFHIKLSNRHTYKKFIRAITSAIAMAITGASRWRPMKSIIDGSFWDFRPFTRVVQGLRDYLSLNNYIEVNQIQACGYTKAQARYILGKEWAQQGDSS